MDIATGAASSPLSRRFSIIVAVYNVAQYLDQFIASIEAQVYPLSDVEVIAVDDGSTDDSLARLYAWRERRSRLVTVLTKANGGQASARNLGMELARGEWLTFVDPDDMLAPGYLWEVDRFLKENPSTELAACSRTLLMEGTGQLQRHPLWRHFEGGNRLRNLNDDPEFFHGSAPCAFFRTSDVRAQRLLFDEQIRPNFEDGHFVTSYLLTRPEPLVGFVESANYIYRKRGDGTSTLQNSLLHPGRYTTVPRRGYLDLLVRSKELLGHVPGWLQSFILYELWWYFSAEDRATGAATAAHGAVADEFHELLAQISAHLDPDLVTTYEIRRYPPSWRDVLLHAYRPAPWNSPYIARERIDRRQKLTRYVYRFTGERPEEVFTVEGVPVQPVHSKIRDLRYFDRVLVRERLLWLPSGEAHAWLNGQEVEVLHTERRPWPTPAIPAVEEKPADSRQDVAIRRLAATKPVRNLFGRAWVLIDRVHDADDSAEHLFRYLRKNNPSINAWFVIEKGTPDYDRLRSQGYRRIVPHGSLRWKLLMLNCQHLISSHADEAVIRPPALRMLIPKGRWRFTFLQHGVIKDDLSTWLNLKDISLFITSTPGEYASVCGDGTTYRYTTKETQLTGLPRFDLVRAEGRRVPPEERDLILIAPTWRVWISPPPPPGSQRRELVPESFLQTEFARNWLELLRSPHLADLADRTHCTLATLLHPNLQQIAPHLGLPPHIRSYAFEGVNVRKLFARARVLVTDYSSTAFNAAYIDRPVVYFQFDQDRMLGGGHVGRKGYFDYATAGFGPVVFDVDSAVKTIIATVEAGPHPAPEYQRRIDETFPLRDGKCRKRVVAAIRASTRPYPAPVADSPDAPGTPDGDGDGDGADDPLEPAEDEQGI